MEEGEVVFRRDLVVRVVTDALAVTLGLPKSELRKHLNPLPISSLIPLRCRLCGSPPVQNSPRRLWGHIQTSMRSPQRDGPHTTLLFILSYGTPTNPFMDAGLAREYVNLRVLLIDYVSLECGDVCTEGSINGNPIIGQAPLSPPVYYKHFANRS